ncbi:MAG: hypothetical protein ACI4R9_07265 [Kiritimatiellia bacterium]
MRVLIFAAGLALAAVVYAGRPVGLGPLPAWDCLDTEVSTNAAFAVVDPNNRYLTFELELYATPSNNVQVAFGRDADGDGVLSVFETALIVGWDCGEWVALGLRPQDAVRSPAQTMNATKRLQWNLYEGNDIPRKLSAAENGTPIPHFDGVCPPNWFLDPGWDMVRLTVRGTDAPNESFRAQMIAPGTRITIR